jgi:hypothetical protein
MKVPRGFFRDTSPTEADPHCALKVEMAWSVDTLGRRVTPRDPPQRSASSAPQRSAASATSSLQWIVSLASSTILHGSDTQFAQPSRPYDTRPCCRLSVGAGRCPEFRALARVRGGARMTRERVRRIRRRRVSCTATKTFERLHTILRSTAHAEDGKLEDDCASSPGERFASKSRPKGAEFETEGKHVHTKAWC